MTHTLDRSDTQLRDRVARQLQRTRDVDAREIGVRANAGEVTLTGTVRSLPEKMAAEEAVKSLFGVRRIANAIVVAPPAAPDDAQLERAANEALCLRAGVPSGVRATVRDGVVTLEGTAAWRFERIAAELAVAYMPGVRGVENRIALTTAETCGSLREEVEQALVRVAGLDWKRIRVTSDGGAVRLAGQVFSLREKEDAERAAWAIPAVTSVDSRLDVASRRWW